MLSRSLSTRGVHSDGCFVELKSINENVWQSTEPYLTAREYAELSKVSSRLTVAGLPRSTGQRASQMAAIQAALMSQTAATLGAATTQRMIIQAAAGFQKIQVGAEVARSIRETNISRDQ